MKATAFFVLADWSFAQSRPTQPWRRVAGFACVTGPAFSLLDLLGDR